MRPIKFTPLAPSTGLTIGAGVARGLNQAAQNYMKIHMQKMQMQAMANRNNAQAQQMQAMAAWRNAQAEKLRQNSVGVDLQKVQLYQSMKKATDPSTGEPIFDPGALKKFEAKHLDQAVSNMNPQERASAIERFNSLADQGKMAPEFSSASNLNEPEAKLYGQMNTAASSLEGKKVVQQAQTDRTQIVRNSMDAQKNAILGTRMTPDQKASQTAMQNYSSQMKEIHQNMMALDKPPALGQATMPDDVKANLRNSYVQDLSDLQEKYNQAYSRASGVQRQSPPFPGAPDDSSRSVSASQTPFYPTPTGGQPQQGARVLPPNQWQQAPVGGIVQHPDGKQFVVRLNGTHPDGSPNMQTYPDLNSAQQAAALLSANPAPQPQSAPTGALAPLANIAPNSQPASPAASGGQ